MISTLNFTMRRMCVASSPLFPSTTDRSDYRRPLGDGCPSRSAEVVREERRGCIVACARDEAFVVVRHTRPTSFHTNCSCRSPRENDSTSIHLHSAPPRKVYSDLEATHCGLCSANANVVHDNSDIVVADLHIHDEVNQLNYVQNWGFETNAGTPFSR